MQNERKGLRMGHTLNGISARSQILDPCSPQQMTNDGKKSIWMIDKSSLLFAIWMCEKWRSERLSSCLLYQTPVLLLSLALSPFAAESWFPSLRFIDMRCIWFASIVHLSFVCIVQDIFWHFSRLAATPFVWNGLICIFSWVGFLAEAAAPLQMQSGSTDYWISNMWCLSVCLSACLPAMEDGSN